MSSATNILLGIAFAVIGVAAALLQAWLWRFPMAPDPSGRDPNGVSTAPRGWTNVHRALGYTFAAIYVVLMTQMVPRIWRFEEFSAAGIMHAILGALIGPILLVKIGIIRFAPRFGKKLPYFGATLATLGLVVVALVVAPAWQAAGFSAPPEARTLRGRAVATNTCITCHGSSILMHEARDREDWLETAEEMQERASRRGITITDHQVSMVSEYLFRIRGENQAGEKDDEGGRRRRRRRGGD